MIVCKRLMLLALLSLSSLLSLTAFAQVQVSASIRPLQLIAAAITDGIAEPALILGLDQSPHQTALRPSQRRAIAQADLLLWVGPSMESTLSKIINVGEDNVITAQSLPGIQIQPLREGVDPHLWLSTDNARAIASALVQSLLSLDAVNSALYQSNLLDFERALDELNTQIQGLIDQQENQAFAVYHNAFQYYEQQFGLQHVVSFTDDEELRPGIRQLLNIKKTLQENEVNCLLVEPSINTQELGNIIDNPRMQYVSIDVLGSNFKIEKSAYRDFMFSLTGAVIECLR